MKLGIMQPYFFPYLGYFSLIKHVDRFVLLDTVQFIRHGWIERNRILKPAEGWQYFRVPLQKHHREALIRDIYIDNTQAWKRQILAQFQHYKKPAPFFSDVMRLMEDVLSNDYPTIVDLNRATLEATRDYLGIRTPIDVFSGMGLSIEPVNAPDDWALNICKAIGGVEEYRNPPGAMGLFDRTKYESNHIHLRFHDVELTTYAQRRQTFEPGLSIVDVMMFNSVGQISQMLDDYELL